MSHRRAGNRLLAALTEDTYHRLEPALEMMTLSQGQNLYSATEPGDWVYFPHQSLISLSIQTVPMEAERTNAGQQTIHQTAASPLAPNTVTIGWVGREGVVGLGALLFELPLPTHCQVLIAGSATQVRLETLQQEWQHSRSFRALLLRYFQARVQVQCQHRSTPGLHGLPEAGNLLDQPERSSGFDGAGHCRYERGDYGKTCSVRVCGQSPSTPQPLRNDVGQSAEHN